MTQKIQTKIIFFLLLWVNLYEEREEATAGNNILQ